MTSMAGSCEAARRQAAPLPALASLIPVTVIIHSSSPSQLSQTPKHIYGTTIHTAVMSSNVGLTTPRGSGTSGYVQKNRSLLRPRDNAAPYPKDWENVKHRQRQPDKEILEHESRREIEVKVFELRDKLEEEGYAMHSLRSYICAVC